MIANPDQVESSEKVAWSVAFWFWNKKVLMNQAVINDHQFGTSTNLMSNKYCKGTNFDVAKSLFARYKIILNAFNINEKPRERGCYPTTEDYSLQTPSFDEFSNALTLNKYPIPTKDQYVNFVNGAYPLGGITTKRELAMFLAQVS